MSIFEGEADYQTFLALLISNQHVANGLNVCDIDASLEGLSDQCKETLSLDRYKIQQLEKQREMPVVIET